MNSNAACKGKKERHILALSGGKDSAALAIYMREKYPDLKLEYVFTDSGCELPETYEYLDRIRALLNIDITQIKPQGNFDYWLKYYKGVLPSPQNRWCTRQLKLRPYEAYIGNDPTYSYIAIRADENREGYNSTKENIKPIYPFVEDGIGYPAVLRLLKLSGLGLPGYQRWRSRSGCYFCFFQSEIEWGGLRKTHKQLFELACRYEERHSDGRVYTWMGKRNGQPMYLKDIKIDATANLPDKERADTTNNKLSHALSDLRIVGSSNKGIIRGGAYV